jgi:hypothetical protein
MINGEVNTTWLSSDESPDDVTSANSMVRVHAIMSSVAGVQYDRGFAAPLADDKLAIPLYVSPGQRTSIALSNFNQTSYERIVYSATGSATSCKSEVQI